ncbi:MAG: biotin--[acetyl-CoA-carboxylase] ligase [Pseudomonadota bacterium]
MDIASLRHKLKTTILGQTEIHYLPSTGSTNDVAKQLAQDGAPEGAIVIADSQTSGKGRLGRSWHSPPGSGLYFSAVLRPDVDPDSLCKITLLAGVAAAGAIEDVTTIRPQIKWPNDLLLHGRKAGGILTELHGDAVSPTVVLGIGINVSTRLEDFPPDLQLKATSLVLAGAKDVSRSELIRSILERLEYWYLPFKKGEHGPMLQAWRKQCAMIGSNAKIRSGEEVCFGRILDIDDTGALLLQDATGQIRRILSGEVLEYSYPP